MAPSSEPIAAEVQQQALEAAQLMVRELDGTILHWTGGMERLYGWPRHEAVGRKSHELLQTVFPRPLADIESALIDQGEWTGELIHRRRDGEHLVAASHWSLWRKGEDAASRVVEVDNDVTRGRGDYEARQYLASIVDSADDAIIGKTLNGIITSWNKAAQSTFGYSPEEAIGKSVTMLFPSDRLDEEERIIERIKHGERVEHFETFRLHKSGVLVPVSLTISPILGTEGQIIGASKIVRDISERHAAQAKLQELQSELLHVARVNTVSHMASGLAHELNQPLTAVANYLRGAQRLLDKSADDQLVPIKDALGRAREQAVRAGEVVKRLRDFLSRGETEFKVESLSQLIKETSHLALLGVSDVTVAFQLDASFDRVLVDRIQIQQVVLNLIRNAVEAMEPLERRALTIGSAAAGSDMVEVSIMDTGPGIAEDVAARLFQPFVTTKGNGMGVGLAISRTIVENHGGRIWIEPNPAGGTIFKLTLPLGAGLSSA